MKIWSKPLANFEFFFPVCKEDNDLSYPERKMFKGSAAMNKIRWFNKNDSNSVV